MKKECSVIRDLLPLHIEGMVSPDTEEFIREHLDGCKECTEELNAMSNICEAEAIGEEMSNDIGALKSVKKRIKRIGLVTVLASVVLTLVLVFAWICIKPATIDYGNSKLYTKEDMDTGIKLIKDEFKTWKGCKLLEIKYMDDGMSERELEYCNCLAQDGVVYTECMVFWMNFRSPLIDSQVLAPNEEYQYFWYLARTDGGEWELLTWGV